MDIAGGVLLLDAQPGENRAFHGQGAFGQGASTTLRRFAAGAQHEAAATFVAGIVWKKKCLRG
jgi:hypothetical protein